MEKKFIPTGIPKLDEYIDGGIPLGSSILYSGEPTINSSVFGMQTFWSCLRNGAKGVYLANTIPPERVVQIFLEYGWDLRQYLNKITFIDCYSGLIGQSSSAELVISDPKDISEIVEKYKSAVRKTGEGMMAVAIGSLSTLIDYCGEDAVLSHIDEIVKIGHEHNTIGIFNLTEWPYKEGAIKRIYDSVNGVVLLKGIEERVIFGQYFAVIKANWCEYERKTILFRVAKPGGVKVFVPKILITGPFMAGKTAFVHALSTKAVSVERKMISGAIEEKKDTTVVLDFGHVEYKGMSADIFGTPGQARFDPILHHLGGSSLGVILVVDSTQPNTFPRAKEMMHQTRTFGLPYIVVANKQDLPNALSPDEIRKIMKLPPEVPVVPCITTQKKGVYEAFETLLNLIM